MNTNTRTPVGESEARTIMGDNFFGVNNALEAFSQDISAEQALHLSEIVTSDGRPMYVEELIRCRDTHLLVADIGLSILEIKSASHDIRRSKVFDRQDWYGFQDFATHWGKGGWWLVRKNPVVGSTSTNKSFLEQCALLSDDEEIPPSRVMAYAMAGHFLNTGERLFEGVCVRCSDFDSDGLRVMVGHLSGRGLYISACWDDGRLDSIGLSAAQKSRRVSL